MVVALGAGCRPSTAPTPASPSPEPSPSPTSTLAAPQPVSPVQASPVAGPQAPNKKGVHLLLDDGGSTWPPDVWDDHLRWAARLVGRGGYVVQLIRADDLRPSYWQRLFDVAAREQLTLIV